MTAHKHRSLNPIVVVIEDGMIQHIGYDGLDLPAPLVIIDYDAADTEPDEQLELVPQGDGDPDIEAHVSVQLTGFPTYAAVMDFARTQVAERLGQRKEADDG